MRHFLEHCFYLGTFKIQLASKHLNWLGYEHKLRANLAYMTAKEGSVQDNLAIGQGLETAQHSARTHDLMVTWSTPVLSGKSVLTLLEVHSSRLWFTKASQQPTPIIKCRSLKPAKPMLATEKQRRNEHQIFRNIKQVFREPENHSTTKVGKDL